MFYKNLQHKITNNDNNDKYEFSVFGIGVVVVFAAAAASFFSFSFVVFVSAVVDSFFIVVVAGDTVAEEGVASTLTVEDFSVVVCTVVVGAEVSVFVEEAIVVEGVVVGVATGVVTTFLVVDIVVFGFNVVVDVVKEEDVGVVVV
uniref:Transmembrane protein n=1 Tax=Panagrolaimus sp. ES5 TaxID=591445 RepID=A0AC34G9H9_9BILA